MKKRGIQKTYRFFTLLFVLLLGCSQPEQFPDPPEMWGQLSPGPYPVGFKTIFLYDASRAAVPYSDWDGKLYPTSETRGRQMQLNVWYPSKARSKNKRLAFEHYVNLMGRATDFSELSQEKIEFANDQFVRKTNALGGNGDFTKTALDSLKNLKTYAYLDAEPAAGPFPLVVFPNGSSPAFQSIMGEYFASHGFVVGATGLKGMEAYTEEASLEGMEMAVIDLDFAVRNLLQLPQVDRNKIGLIGNAITASQSIAYQNRNSNIDCVISLEGGLLSSFEQRILNKTPFYDVQSVDVPILALYAPHPAIDPQHIFHLKHADRYFFHFPQMTEFHMLNYGQFERFIPNIIGKHEGEVSHGHKLASEYCLAFLEAFLKDDINSKSFLEQPIPPENQAHIDTAFIKKALPKAPGITAIKNAYNKHGFTYIDSIYQAYKKTDQAPYSSTFYSDLKDWLAWKKDPDYQDRYALYKLAYESYPNSAETNYYLGYYALETRNLTEAKFHMEKALDILEENANPELTIDRTNRIAESIQVFLAEADSLARKN